VRSRLGGWLGIALVAAGVLLCASSRYWLATRTFVPLDIPVSLARGHIRTGEFKINLDATYFVGIQLGANGTGSCGAAYGHDMVQTLWTVTLDGKTVPPGGKLPKAGCDVGMLSGGPGRYELDIEVVSDTATLDTLNPRLHIETYWWDYAEANDTADDFLALGIFLVVVGTSLLLLSSIGSNRRWPQEVALHISPPRANRLRIPRRDSRLLDPRSTAPLLGYVYAVTYMVVFLVNAPFYLATWFYDSGLPVRLVRPGVILVASGRETGLLVYVDQSGNFYLNSKPITAQDLPPALEAELDRRADHTVYVEGDPTIEYGAVVQAMSLVRAAGGDVVMMTPKFRAETSGNPR
jgi:biopolymer transport protein ExbD